MSMSPPPAVARSTQTTGFPDAHVDVERTTVGVPMVGDPRFNPLGGLMGRRACQYAVAMARKQGLISDDASDLDASFGGSNTIVFVLADATQREVARFTIPHRVMMFDPGRPPLRLPDERGEP